MASDWFARSKAKSRLFQLSEHCDSEEASLNSFVEKGRCWIFFGAQIVPLKFSKCVSYLYLVGALQREHSKHSNIAAGHAAHQETPEEPLPVMTVPD